MTRNGNRPARSWLHAVALAALIAGPILLYFLLPLLGVPIALASGLVAIVALKHLGLLAVLAAPLYAIFRRRRRRRASRPATPRF
jgi:hypothetical protein